MFCYWAESFVITGGAKKVAFPSPSLSSLFLLVTSMAPFFPFSPYFFMAA